MKLEIAGVHDLANKDVEKYIRRKIGKLDKYIPRHARKSAHAEVKVKERSSQKSKECMCEVVVHLPGENIAAKDSTVNMFAAIDIVEEKIKRQLKKYKTKVNSQKRTPIKRILRRLTPSGQPE